jgi:hypothetical protein
MMCPIFYADFEIKQSLGRKIARQTYVLFGTSAFQKFDYTI